jgi:hypothetical protein
VVTLLTPLPVEPELDEDDDEPLLWTLLRPDEPVEPLEPELLVVAVVVVGFEATAVPDDPVEVWLASAGSCPETSTTAIISQAATNSAIAAETTRRRMVRARATRALRSACPRARAAAASLSVMVQVPRVFDGGRVEAWE